MSNVKYLCKWWTGIGWTMFYVLKMENLTLRGFRETENGGKKG